MTVKSGRNENTFRLKVFGGRDQDLLEYVAILLIPLSSRERHIDGQTFPLTCPGFRRPARPGLKWGLVGAKKKDSGIIIEGLLRAIAVVHIPIHNHHPL